MKRKYQMYHPWWVYVLQGIAGLTIFAGFVKMIHGSDSVGIGIVMLGTFFLLFTTGSRCWDLRFVLAKYEDHPRLVKEKSAYEKERFGRSLST